MNKIYDSSCIPRLHINLMQISIFLTCNCFFSPIYQILFKFNSVHYYVISSYSLCFVQTDRRGRERERHSNVFFYFLKRHATLRTIIKGKEVNWGKAFSRRLIERKEASFLVASRVSPPLFFRCFVREWTTFPSFTFFLRE